MDNINESVIDELCSFSFGSYFDNDSLIVSTDTDNSVKLSNTITSSFLSDISEDSQSFAFPEDKEMSMESIDWSVLEPVITFVSSKCISHEYKPSSHKYKQANSILSDKSIENKTGLVESPRKLFPKKDSVDQSIFFDPRYLYFLKKACNLSKKECVAYGKGADKTTDRSFK
ncbi:uncharacterized protein VICG_00329 [Vittaforma corneae ATCC 50505]|uniref:Uncharacterized protein n=1 Tax=Vittaforma corneae (strain ATCC 50505) TaxID=993615 RepID=L2GQH1_VITCO|nr:uncharacterized protein VICG_00329 [Vittaforma corneae ATCC 50505]ELA42577.1 hypothetical protein VICG_00329 [Vittaforma corneae ATCC 50505]